MSQHDKQFQQLQDAKALFRDAVINWCVNTEKFLNEARRLKKEKVRLPSKGLIIRRWERQTNFLICKVIKDMMWQEHREVCNSYYNDLMAPSKFLDAIPDVA